jgi:hypothetical protein
MGAQYLGWARIVTRRVFLEADTTTVRIILAWASLVWAVSITFDHNTFARPAYGLIRQMGPSWVWAVALTLHFVGVHWRIYDRRGRPAWGVAINAYGLSIWLCLTICMNLSIGAWAPSTAMEQVMCAFSAWALYRTGLRPEIVSP